MCIRDRNQFPNIKLLSPRAKESLIELGQLGAYGLTFRTQFNGYYSNKIVLVEDEPILTMYDKKAKSDFLVA